jgi:hypothetical protein
MESGMRSATVPTQSFCPSAQPDMDGARVFAVVCGTPEKPTVAYLDQAHPVTQELLAMAAPVSPTEVFRFTTTCGAAECRHFDSTRDACRLAEKAIRIFPAAVQRLAHCAIRTDCRWWQQEGPEGCKRCAQVVTTNHSLTAELIQLANPETV